MQPPRPTGPKHIEILARGWAVRDGRVLVCRSVEGGYCYLPGGHVDPGEAAATALAREFVEEAALVVTVGKLAVISEERFAQNGKPRHELNLVFHVELPEGTNEVRSIEPEIAFEWLPPSELRAHRFLPESLIEVLEGGLSERDGPRSLAPHQDPGSEGPWLIA
jgi:8-oxo-dGTP diphosphatase